MRLSTRCTRTDLRSPSKATALCLCIRGIDWVCISPKAGSQTVQRSGDELKLVWPQPGSDTLLMEQWNFANFLIQPMDKRVDASRMQPTSTRLRILS